MPKNGPIVRARIDYERLLRNAPMAGVSTAINSQGPVIINEPWSTLTFDGTNTWTSAVVATGTVAQGNAGGLTGCLLDAPAASDEARLEGRRRAINPVAATEADDIYQKLILEWQMELGTLANIDNAKFFVGLVGGGSADTLRTSDNIIGFILASDALNTITDNGGTETVNVVTGNSSLVANRKYKIVVRNGAVDFYTSNVLRNTHTANIVAAPVRFHAKIFAEAATGATKIQLGPVRMYLVDYT